MQPTCSWWDGKNRSKTLFSLEEDSREFFHNETRRILNCSQKVSWLHLRGLRAALSCSVWLGDRLNSKRSSGSLLLLVASCLDGRQVPARLWCGEGRQRGGVALSCCPSHKDVAMLSICWLTPVGWKAALGLIWGDYLKSLESVSVLEHSFVKHKTLNLSFQTALRESEFMMLCCISVHGLYMQSVQGSKLLFKLQYWGLHLRVCFKCFIMKKGLHVKFKAKLSVPWCL